MRRILESTLVSLDGVIDTPPRWAGDYLDDDFQKDALARLSECDAMLMGRVSYEMFYGAFVSRTDDFAKCINGIRKYVFSSTLPDPEWSNSRIVRDDVSPFVKKLKSQNAGDIAIYGHGKLSQTLLKDGLIDELRVTIFPVMVGGGKLLFRPGEHGNLKLIEAHGLRSGGVVIRYQPSVEG